MSSPLMVANRVTTLLSFVGFHDPFHPTALAGEEQAGPVLSLLAARPFDRAVLFETPSTEHRAQELAEAIAERHPTTVVVRRPVAVPDPTDYADVLAALRAEVPSLLEGGPSDLFVSTASGTPQMHACWLLLVAGGELPARILQVRPPRFVSAGRPLVTEVDPAHSAFPTVRSGLFGASPEGRTPDLDGALREVGLVGTHPRLMDAAETVALLAPYDVPVLLLGETGTGKELFARLAHRLSGRPTGALVVQNCAAVPKDLAESVLFGHTRGAFSGATADHPGKFVQADGGTLFLDELGELPLDVQAKLLRVLEDGRVDPVGSRSPVVVDVRVVAATNRDIRRDVAEGRFREDLYHRLNVGEVRLPPLRERRADIAPLALGFLDRINAQRRSPVRLTAAALARLQALEWTGNVRALRHVVERSVMLARGPVVDADDLRLETLTGGAALAPTALPEPHPGFDLKGYLADVRSHLVSRALEMTGGVQAEAARLLGVSQQAVSRFVGDRGGGAGE